jgi:hypothetical protein
MQKTVRLAQRLAALPEHPPHAASSIDQKRYRDMLDTIEIALEILEHIEKGD